jgi:hypothetical protein
MTVSADTEPVQGPGSTHALAHPRQVSVHATGPTSAAATSDRPGRVPDFFIVGHPKCGTTALWEMLRLHPQVYMPDVKELRFFGIDMHPRAERSPGSRLPDTLEDYVALFEQASPAQRAGEASPLYLMSHVAAGQIAQVQPAARVIAILREPASFLRSLHMQWVRSHFETEKDLRAAMLLERDRRAGRRIPRSSRLRPHILFYSEHIRYVEQLRRFHDVLPPEQMQVLIYDDFRSDNQETMRAVLRFIGVDEAVPVAIKDANPSVRVRSQRLDRMVHAVSTGRDPVSRVAKGTLKALAPRPLRRRALSVTQRRMVYAQPDPPDESFMLELRRRFSDEVVALSEYLDRDLVSLWGYDRLA